MAQYLPAFSFLMGNEDSRLQYADVPDAGGRAISGINSLSFPDDYARIAAIAQIQRGPAVAEFYLKNFWNPMRAGGIEDQEVANRYFDAGVNMGMHTSCKLLQEAVNLLKPDLLKEDGMNGPATLAAVNAQDPESLLAAFRSLRMGHYQAIIDRDPSKAIYKSSWSARAQA
jgi:lysozyme family protein